MSDLIEHGLPGEWVRVSHEVSPHELTRDEDTSIFGYPCQVWLLYGWIDPSGSQVVGRLPTEPAELHVSPPTGTVGRPM
jgi:hypothetical protein